MKVFKAADLPDSFTVPFEKNFLGKVIPLGNCIFKITSVNGKQRKMTLELQEVMFPEPHELPKPEEQQSK